MWKRDNSSKGTFPHEHHHGQQSRVYNKGLIGDHWTFIGSYHLIDQAKEGGGKAGQGVDGWKNCSAKWLLSKETRHIPGALVCHSACASAQLDFSICTRNQRWRPRTECSIRWDERVELGGRWCWSANKHQVTPQRSSAIPTWGWLSMYIWIHIGVYR